MSVQQSNHGSSAARTMGRAMGRAIRAWCYATLLCSCLSLLLLFIRHSQMTTSHYGALVIAVGILYSNAFVALAWMFYDIAYSRGASTQECPETHLDFSGACTFGDTTEVAPWSVLFGSLLGIIIVSFKFLKWLAHWQDLHWLTFCSRFVGHMIGFRFRALVYKLVGTTVIYQLSV